MQRSVPWEAQAEPPTRPMRAVRQRPRRGRRVLRRLVRLAAALVAACVAAFGLVVLVSPSVGNAPQLARAFDRAHGAPYPGAAAPPRFAAALEATEDHRFGSVFEPGVDPVAVGRVIAGFAAGRLNQGGATLYQQLAKQLYTPGRDGPDTKAEQAALAIKLRYSYSGAEILRLYGDVTYFGHGFYGLQQASCGYFGVRPAELSWPQAALLAGLVQAPTADDPIASPAAGLAREQHVLGRLVADGDISQASASAYQAIPLSALLAHAGTCTA